MEAQKLKEFIYENNLIQQILEDIGCHHIKYHSSGNPDPYLTAANPDGNNASAIVVYNKPNLKCINYTRDISKNPDCADIISLVCFIKQLSFFEGLKYICNAIGIDYYKDFDEDIPESLRITNLIFELQQNIEIDEEEKPLKPISEKILSYYKPYVNDMFYNDGIDYLIQKEFEIAYDEETNRITIPIRDEIGNLVGVKGRLFKSQLDEDDIKYIYLEPCARSKILYGLYKTYDYIQEKGSCYIFESEKATMQAWSMEYKNCVSIGGSKVTESQIEKLTRLGTDLIFAFDKDISQSFIESIADRFVNGVNIYCIIDKDNILEKKESPTDKKEKWQYLLENNIYKIK